jgi:hypothetical protein
MSFIRLRRASRQHSPNQGGFREVDLLKRWRSRLWIESLENRLVLDFRSITGVGNNIAHASWGASGTDLLRVSPVAYADHISAPSQPNTINPRVISNNIGNQSSFIFSFMDDNGGPNKQRLSDYSYAWGQFIDHDMDLTPDNSGQPFDIQHDGRTFTQPDGTHVTDPIGTEPFTRSQFDPSTGTSASNPRQQVNVVTSYLDLSQVYGSTDLIASALRTHSDGLMKTSPGDFLPLNNHTYFPGISLDPNDPSAALDMANDAHQVPDSQLFAAGDRRANENIELTSLTTLFLRNHNRLAGQLAAINPGVFGFSSWTDELLYQEARKLNIAEEEIIMYTGYIPSILGATALPAYPGYNSNLNAGIATEFSTVGFRFGHSLLSNTVGRDQNNGTGITDVSGSSAINLTEDFFRPDLLNNNHVTVTLTNRFGQPDPHTSSTVGEVVKGLADGTPNETDLLLIDEVRTLLFGIPNGPGTDLDARDVQRARDHGIGTYNQVRVAYGLPAVTSYTQISSDPGVRAALAGTYGPDTPANVNKIDPFEGMLAEDHVAGDAGPTEKAILVKQFVALRDGDRFFYLNESFNSTEQALINQGNSLAKVIMNNTSITNLQTDVFTNQMEISGHVFADPDGNGVQGDTEPALAGVTVDLADANGVPIPGVTAVTDASGEYDFTDQTGIASTGQYTVILDATANPHLTQTAAQVAADPHPLLSRGDFQVTNQDLGVISREVNFLNGFATTASLQLNGSAEVSGSNLRLTDGGNFEAGSTFTTTQVSIARFDTFFTFQLTNPNADGFTFTIQRQDPAALGPSGGGLGYGPDTPAGTGGIPHSAAIKFDLFNNQGEGNDSTGLYFNGASPTVPSVDLSNTGIDLHSGHQFEGRIVYDGSTLTLRIDDNVTGAIVEVVFSGVNIPGAIGGSTAFVGFTGGTGGLTATQDIQNWNFIPITSGGAPAVGDGGPSSVAVVLGGIAEGPPLASAALAAADPNQQLAASAGLGSSAPTSPQTSTNIDAPALNPVAALPDPGVAASAPQAAAGPDTSVTAPSSSDALDPLAADQFFANPL